MYNQKIDFIHNVYGFVYCIQMFYFNMLLLFYKNDTNYLITSFNTICMYSFIYFIISSSINYLDKNYIFLVHHLICIITLLYGYIYQEPEYIVWVANTFLAEFSTIFLSFSKITRFLKNNEITISNKTTNFITKITNLSDNLFVLSYYSIRILYLLPLSISFLYKYKFVGIFNFILPLVSLVMIGMNLYWAVLIYNKISNPDKLNKISSKTNRNKQN